MVPIGSGIGDIEFVGKAFARCDRFLGQVGHAVHRVRHAKTVPVDCGFLVKPVVNDDAYPIALPDADFSSGHLAVIRPDRRFRIFGAGQPRASRRGRKSVVTCTRRPSAAKGQRRC